jgi:Fe-S-cluster containining protein
MESPLKPCATCTFACCKKGPYAITAEDLVRLSKEEQEVCIKGPFNQIFLPSLPNGTCGFLTPRGCGVHPRKPQGCRDLDAWNCGMYEADPKLVDDPLPFT